MAAARSRFFVITGHADFLFSSLHRSPSFHSGDTTSIIGQFPQNCKRLRLPSHPILTGGADARQAAILNLTWFFDPALEFF
jgi:hypothetical protein